LLRTSVLFFLALIVFVSACGANTKEDLYAEGLKLLEQGNPQGAIVALRNALEKDQNFFEARFQLAKSYLALERHDLAEQELRKVRLQSPSHPEVSLEMARVYLRTDRLEQAREEAEAFLETVPDSVPALLILGEVSGQETDLEQAKERYARVLAIAPEEPEALVGLAKVALIQGEMDAARDHLNAALLKRPDHLETLYLLADIQQRREETDGLLQTLTAITRVNPEDVNAFYRLGMIRLDKGEIQAVDELAGRLREKYPRRAEGFALEGLKYFQEQNFPEAIVALQQANSIQPSLESHFYLGLSLYQTGELESAMSEFRTVLDRRPDFVQARLMTAQILLQQQRLDVAVEEAQRIIRQDPGNAMAFNVLGSAYMALGDHGQGMDALQTATRLNPALVDSYLKQGMFHLSQGSAAEAESTLDSAIQIAPDQMQIRMLQFANHMQQGETDKALELLREGPDAALYNNMAAVHFSRNNPAEALELLAKAKASDPTYLPAYFNAASHFMALREPARALEEYQAALEQDPDNSRALLEAARLSAMLGQDDHAADYLKRARATNQPRAFLATADHHLRRGQLEQAMTTLNQGLETAPDNLPLKEAKGRLHLSRKEFDQAIALFEEIRTQQEESGLQLLAIAHLQKGDADTARDLARKFIALHPDRSDGYLLAAAIEESVGNLDQAEAQVGSAIQADPENALALLRLGNLQARKGNMDLALQTYQRAEQINPDFVPAIFAQGALLEAQERFALAVEAHRRALQKNQDYAPALNNLAYLHLKGHGDTAEALQLAAQAFRLDPGNPGIMDTLGLALVVNDRAAEAVPLLERAAAILPDNPTLRYHLALAYKGANDPAKALEQVNRALEQGQFPEADDARLLQRELQDVGQ